MCHHNLISKDFTIQPVSNPQNIQFTNGYLVNKEYTDLFEKIGNATTSELYPDGTWDTRTSPGIYVITLLDGNGGQPEYVVVQITANYRSDVIFIGHAVTFWNTQLPPEPACPKVTDYSLTRNAERFKFIVENSEDDAKWITVSYTVSYYSPVILCESKDQPNKIHDCITTSSISVMPDLTTITKELNHQVYAKPGTSKHFGKIAYDGRHQFETLINVRVTSCSDASCIDKPKEKPIDEEWVTNE
jgi:hypothetical protein